MSGQFDIFLLPTLGATNDHVSRLAAEFGIPLDRARALLASAPVRIKSNAGLEEAQRYEAALRGAGLECERRLVGSADEAALQLDTSPAPVAPPPAAAPAPAQPMIPVAAAPLPPNPKAPPPRGILGTPITGDEGAPVDVQRSRVRNTTLGGVIALLLVVGAVGLVYMKLRSPRMGGLVVERLGDAGKGSPALVLLHGYGAPGDDLVSLGKELLESNPDIQVIVPEAPFDAGRGQAWYVKDQTEAESSRNKLLKLIQQLIREGTLPDAIIVAGFSQGGIMAMDATLNYPETIGGVAVLSGGDEKGFGWSRLFETNSTLRVFISHGKQDSVLGYRSMERFAGELETAGYQVELLLFEGGHAIPHEVRDALSLFISTVLGS